jgi:hypothetical protein
MQGTMKWFNKFLTNERTGSLNCPNCNFSFDEQVLYSLEPRACSNCGKKIVTIRRLRCIYTVDLDQSPELFKIIYSRLSTLTLKEAYSELDELAFFLADNFENPTP